MEAAHQSEKRLPDHDPLAIAASSADDLHQVFSRTPERNDLQLTLTYHRAMRLSQNILPFCSGQWHQIFEPPVEPAIDSRITVPDTRPPESIGVEGAEK